jgi:hypothetical protein
MNFEVHQLTYGFYPGDEKSLGNGEEWTLGKRQSLF